MLMEHNIKFFDEEKSKRVFGAEYNEALVHQVVTAYLAAGRAGTHQQKRRSDVSGGGKKPWKQKGSGRARAGTIRSPIWRGGGVTFAAVPQDYSQKVNKKMYVGAMRAIFSALANEKRIAVIEELNASPLKTKDFVAKLKELNLKEALIITDEINENLYLATRNLLKITVLGVKDIDPVCLVNAKNVVITFSALREIEKVWG